VLVSSAIGGFLLLKSKWNESRETFPERKELAVLRVAAEAFGAAVFDAFGRCSRLRVEARG
jgi:hypothetical protein